jgi:hypothetical protein
MTRKNNFANLTRWQTKQTCKYENIANIANIANLQRSAIRLFFIKNEPSKFFPLDFSKPGVYK